MTEIRLLTADAEMAAYDHWVKTHPQGTLWQSVEWKRFRDAQGKTVRIYAALEGSSIVASALVVIDKTAFGLSTWDCPRGPLGPKDSNSKFQIPEELMEKIIEDAEQDKCFSLFVSPCLEFEAWNLEFSSSARHEQPEATRIVDLFLPEEQILMQMHQKGRYNIKVAEKNGVVVRESNDAQAFAELLRTTAQRDGFSVASAKHYETFLKELPGSFLLLAYIPSLQSPVSGLMGTIWNGTGIYYYGASDYEHRALMATYLLQWEAMKRCKAAGCTHYDLLGIAPPNSPPDHPWQGITGFKEKFGGTIVEYPKEKELVMKPMMKRLLGWKRKFF